MEEWEKMERAAKAFKKEANDIEYRSAQIHGWTHGEDSERAREMRRHAKFVEDKACEMRTSYVNWLWTGQ